MIEQEIFKKKLEIKESNDIKLLREVTKAILKQNEQSIWQLSKMLTRKFMNRA